MLKPRRFDGAALYHKTRCEKGWPGRSETEELERRAIGSLCERQRGGRNLLAGLQGKEHRAVLVGIVGREVLAPSLSVLTIAALKSRRVCMTDPIAPKVVEAVCNCVSALLTLLSAALTSLLDWKSPLLAATPSPEEVRSVPLMVTVDVPVSLSVTGRDEPVSKLIPLKPASWAARSICVTSELNCAARLVRVLSGYNS